MSEGAWTSGQMTTRHPALDVRECARACVLSSDTWQVRRCVRVFVGLCFSMLSVVLAGCGATGDPASSENNADQKSSDVLRSSVERGPVQFTVEVSPAKPRLSDSPELRLIIRATKGVRIEKPPFGEALGDFVIRDFREPVAEPEEDTQVIEQVYTLEPTRAGALTVAPIAIRFFDERKEGDGREHTIESEALAVEVTTVHGDEAPSLADLRPAKGPVDLPAGTGFGWMVIVGTILVLVVVGLIVRRYRRRRESVEPQLTPQELAWLELEQIVERNLAETDVKEFYVELTGVVRRYIERSTGVHAPEQTTEEFLREIMDKAVFAGDDEQRLRNFLESADLVKFAAFEPAAADIEASFDRAKEFIRLKRSSETRPHEVAV